MKKLIGLLVLFSLPALAQQINPSTQVNWPLVTGSGAPTISCGSVNYGQPYTDTTANKQYVCSTSGWTAVSASSLTLQTNGTDNASQSLLNFNNTTPAAPSGYTNVLWQNSGGNESAYVPSSVPTGTTNQLLYYAAGGNTVSPLTLGTNLSITGGTLNAAGAATFAYPGINYATSASASTLATPIQFAPQMFDRKDNLTLDPGRTVPIYNGTGSNPAYGNTIVGAGSGSQIGVGWANSSVAGIGANNQLFGNGIMSSSTVAADNVASGDGCLGNFIGFVTSNTAPGGDPSDGNNTCYGSDTDYDLAWAWEEVDLGQKAHQDTNGASSPSNNGWTGQSNDSFVEGIHGDWMDRVDASFVLGPNISRYMNGDLDLANSFVAGNASLSCISGGCPVAGTVVENDGDTFLMGGGSAFDVSDMTAIGNGAGSNAVASQATGAVASVGISNGGSYTGGCPTITFSAPPSPGVTATAAAPPVGCSYNFLTNTYSVAYVGGLPSGTGYDQFTFATTTSGSTTITVAAATFVNNTPISVGETVFANGIPAGDTVTAVSGLTITLATAATATQSSTRAIFGTAPTVTATCTSPCTSGSGFAGVAFLTGEGQNLSVYMGFNAGLNASSQGGVNTVVGSSSFQNAVSAVTSFGASNGSSDTGDLRSEFMGAGLGASGGSYDVLGGYAIQCTSCSSVIELGNNITSPSSAISNSVILIPKSYYAAPLCSNCMQLDNMVYADFNTGDLNANLVNTSVAASVIPSQTTITLSSSITHISGTASIATMNPPAVNAGFGASFTGCVYLIADGQWSTTTAGNILNAITISAQQVGSTITACYGGSKWYMSVPTVSTQNANTVYAGPSSGAAAVPTFRSLVAADIPTLNQNTTGNAATATALAATPSGCTSGQFSQGIAANGNANCASAQGSVTQIAANTFAGACSMSAATSCTQTIAHSYTTPICLVTQQSSALTAGAVGCTVSGTTVTITAATANSETFGFLVVGNPN